MTDLLGERVALANPIPAAALGELHPLGSAKLIADITGARRSSPQRRARRMVPALLLALAVAAPVALAAARTHLLDFALGDPAPPAAKAALDRMLEPAYGPTQGPPQGRTRKDIIPGSERLVAQMTTSVGAHAQMYAVSLRGGGACWYAEGRPFGGGGCGGAALHRTTTIGGTIGMLYAGMGKREPGTFGQGVTLFGPVGARGAATLRVTFKDSDTGSVPVQRGWFMYEVPLPHTHWGHEPIRIDVLDRSGRVLASVNDPFGLHPPEQPKAEQALEPHTLLAQAPLAWQGASIELLLARGSKGDTCVQARNTGNLAQTRRWLCDPAVGRDSAVGLQPPSAITQPVRFEFGRLAKLGRPGGYVYVWGWAGPPVASLEIRFQDSTIERLPLKRRFFLYVVPPAHWKLGTRPSSVIGRSASGRVVYRRFLYPRGRCLYPLRDPRCAGTINQNG